MPCVHFFAIIPLMIILVPGFQTTLVIPTVFVCFGSIPLYLKLNIEMAARENPVVVLTDSTQNNLTIRYREITIEPIGTYMSEANNFKQLYKHISKDKR